MPLVNEFDDYVRLNPLSEATAHAARLTIAEHATGPADLALLLDKIRPAAHRPEDAS